MFEFAAFLLTLVAASGWLNQRFVGLPRTTALLVLGAAFSAALFGADKLGHRVGLDFDLSSWIGEIDFSATVLQGMLGFLLFAGALHVEFDELRTRRWTMRHLFLAEAPTERAADMPRRNHGAFRG